MLQSERFRFLSDPQRSFNLEPGVVRSLVPSDLSVSDAEIIDNVILSLEACGQPPFQWGPQEQFFVERCSASHIVPYLIYRYKMSVFPMQRIVAEFPVYALIEPASPCNLRCVMCFQVDRSFTKKPYMGFMDYDLYTSIVDQLAAGGTRALTFASRGEPLLNPRLPDMLSYAASKGTFFDIKLNTNGTLLNEKAAHAILGAGTSIVVVSADSADPKQYAEIRVRGDFATVLANVERLIDIREKHYRGSRTEIRVAGVRVGPDQDEATFNSFWSKIVDTVAFADAELRWDTYNNTLHPHKTHACDYLWERIYIWWSGQYNVCDVDYKSLLSPGTFKQASIADTWHGDAYTRLREAHLAGLRGQFNPCDRCGV